MYTAYGITKKTQFIDAKIEAEDLFEGAAILSIPRRLQCYDR